MGEAARDETSMEEILSSIRRKINGQEDADRGEAVSVPTQQKIYSRPQKGTHGKGLDQSEPFSRVQKDRDDGRSTDDMGAVRAALSSLAGSVMDDEEMSAGSADTTRGQVRDLEPLAAEDMKSSDPNEDKHVSETHGSTNKASVFNDLEQESDVESERNSRNSVATETAGQFEAKSVIEREETNTTASEEKGTTRAETDSGAPIDKGTLKREAVSGSLIGNLGETVVDEFNAYVAASENPAPLGDPETQFREALVAPETEQMVSGLIRRLKRAIEDSDAAKIETMLRPMLSQWLDENLPDLVERLVQREIDRIVKGG